MGSLIHKIHSAIYDIVMGMYLHYDISTVVIMVPILDDSSEHGAHKWSKVSISICLRHFATPLSNSIFFWKRPFILNSCTTCSELPSYISTLVINK